MQGRKPIHYGIFLGAGLLMVLVSGASLIFSSGVRQEAMQLFLGIGGLFLLIGIIKFIMNKVTTISENEARFEKRVSGVEEIDKAEKKMQSQSQAQGVPTVVVCSRCEARNYSSSNYCHMCGLRLK